MDTLGKMLDLLAAVIVMAVFPALWGTYQQSLLTDQTVYCLTESFVSRACSSGIIDPRSEENYRAELLTLGEYTVRITVIEHIYEPYGTTEDGKTGIEVYDRETDQPEMIRHPLENGSGIRVTVSGTEGLCCIVYGTVMVSA